MKYDNTNNGITLPMRLGPKLNLHQVRQFIRVINTYYSTIAIIVLTIRNKYLNYFKTPEILKTDCEVMGAISKIKVNMGFTRFGSRNSSLNLNYSPRRLPACFMLYGAGRKGTLPDYAIQAEKNVDNYNRNNANRIRSLKKTHTFFIKLIDNYSVPCLSPTQGVGGDFETDKLIRLKFPILTNYRPKMRTNPLFRAKG